MANMSRTALVLLLACSFANAAPAQQQITLACQSTVASPMVEGDKPDPVLVGIIVDFATRIVLGFGSPEWMDYPVTIKAANDVQVTFGGEQQFGVSVSSIYGGLDRVTGDVEAMRTLSDQKTGKTISQTLYKLQCRPAQRMF